MKLGELKEQIDQMINLAGHNAEVKIWNVSEMTFGPLAVASVDGIRGDFTNADRIGAVLKISQEKKG